MRTIATVVTALGAIIVATCLGLLISHGVQSFLAHNEGVRVGLLFVGALLMYIGTLLRRRAYVMKTRQPNA